ncbi:MAG: FAD-dependent oxidoreductase [Clostridia bacterium]|nr:FAD-dependent oxidoreductase [Clostridia bacterium]
MGSIWEGHMPKFAPLSKDIHADVLVIGGGLTGLLCAYKLRTAGVNAVIVEANTPCSGVTGRTTAKITTQHGTVYHRIAERYGKPTARQYFEANAEALEEYRRLNGDIGVHTCDGYLFSRGDRDLLKQESLALRAIGADVEWADEVELPFPVSGALRIPHQMTVQPLKLAARLAADIPIYTGTRVREIRGSIVTTDCGATVTARDIIVATHFPFLNRHGAYFLKLYQHRAYAVAVENTPPMKNMYWEDRADGLTFRQDGERLIIVGGGHRTGTSGVAWKAAERAARKFGSAATVSARWATQDCMSLDGMPYIGRYGTATPHVYAATGYNGWGMTSAMVAALLLTGEITGRKKPWASVFSPQRTVLHRQLVVNAAESFKNLVTPTVPRCPHLGCALKWNADEHSWDCPCHGSRFAEDGTLLNGPSTGNLKEG